MPIDWAATGQMLSGWGSLAGAGAVAFAAWKAAETVDKWRTKKIEERRFDHAERTLAATYNAKEAIDQIRSPLVHGIEFERARRELEADDGWQLIAEDKKERFATCQAIIRRIRSTEEAWDEVTEVLPLAKALFDDDLEKALQSLLHCRWKIRVSLDLYSQDVEADPDFAVKLRKEIWGRIGEGEDDISVAARSAIETIEGKCLPVLRG
ncbi:hypothetical protein GRI58_03650 [Porphyrobacter algicida]|uniref:Uncharacterized protein n=1 Tax=Qipengyuania algicida TaxID=1836209 RepID=A0A845AH76_9SPHN|nr:hypothetical protein [Qipengyuania algicida]MXP27916.1 hypothetical protein [Qipengyuania algicida]